METTGHTDDTNVLCSHDNEVVDNSQDNVCAPATPSPKETPTQNNEEAIAASNVPATTTTSSPPGLTTDNSSSTPQDASTEAPTDFEAYLAATAAAATGTTPVTHEALSRTSATTEPIDIEAYIAAMANEVRPTSPPLIRRSSTQEPREFEAYVAETAARYGLMSTKTATLQQPGIELMNLQPQNGGQNDKALDADVREERKGGVLKRLCVSLVDCFVCAPCRNDEKACCGSEGCCGGCKCRYCCWQCCGPCCEWLPLCARLLSCSRVLILCSLCWCCL